MVIRIYITIKLLIRYFRIYNNITTIYVNYSDIIIHVHVIKMTDHNQFRALLI